MLQELRNGRLAMLAFSGIATVGVLTQVSHGPFGMGNDGKITGKQWENGDLIGKSQENHRKMVI